MAKKKSPLYSPHPGLEYMKAVIENLKDRTGKSMTQWAKVVKKDGPTTAKDQRAWLKKEFGLGGTTVMAITENIAGKHAWLKNPTEYSKEAEKMVDAMYGGKKAHLRPLYDQLLKLALALGNDVRVSPCKTIVPLYRKHVFAEIKPATQKRIDLSFALKASKKKIPKSFIDTGGLEKGNRLTHRIEITEEKDINSLVENWLAYAYELDAG